MLNGIKGQLIKIYGLLVPRIKIAVQKMELVNQRNIGPTLELKDVDKQK